MTGSAYALLSLPLSCPTQLTAICSDNKSGSNEACYLYPSDLWPSPERVSLELEKYRVLDRLEMISVLLIEEPVLLSTGIPLTFCSVH